MITTIILTYNEEIHLRRCIESVQSISEKVIIIDSFSNDRTIEIAKELGAEVYQNPFVNQAKQFQWGLDNCNIDSEWILRLDADEFLLPELSTEISAKTPHLSSDINGVYLRRQVHFMDKWIKYGGYYPIKLLRLWRNGKATIEQKWMDEHVILKEGKTSEFEYDFVDDNLNNLAWWTQKHNNYSNRELIEYFNEKYNLFESENISLDSNTQESLKRKNKVKYYNKAPLFLRAFLYFIYRYFFKLGFLDGIKGLIWHFLQGFWYRFLVDAKIFQIEYIAKKQNRSMLSVIKEDFGIKI